MNKPLRLGLPVVLNVEQNAVEIDAVVSISCYASGKRLSSRVAVESQKAEVESFQNTIWGDGRSQKPYRRYSVRPRRLRIFLPAQMQLHGVACNA